MFRKDINGLRAIAVIVVVLFHFNADWMPGGFAGVDIFFVISGFLMTGIIFRGIEQHNFSVLKFYIARANRIIPALSVLCFVLFVFGWFYLTPMDYKALGKHIYGSISFLSNAMYWRESGYFETASHEKWLLHTWSLSVEWQFYLIYPIVLVAMRRFVSLQKMKTMILLGMVIGFAFCVVATYKWPDPSYYLLPTRAWEMMVGGVAYIYPFNIKSKLKIRLEWAGLLLIIASCYFISKEIPWPGYLSLLPVLGTFLIIQAQRNDSVITNNIIFQKIGTWSYSIYLWHWPIVVAIYYFSLSEIFIYIGMLSSVFIGFLSYKYIESIKFNNLFYGPFDYLKFKPAYMVLFIGLFGYLAVLSDGFVVRSNNEAYTINNITERLKANFGLDRECSDDFTLSENCRTNESPEILIWGDSFSMHLVSGILASNPDAKIVQMTKSNCGPFFDVAPVRVGNFADRCLEFTESVRKWLHSNSSIQYAVISSPFTLYYSPDAKVKLRSGDEIMISKDEAKEEFISTLNELERLGITPVIFSPPPSTGDNIGKCLDQASFFGGELSGCDFNKSQITKIQVTIYDWLLELKSNYNVINLDDYLCNSDVCKTHFGNIFVYRDKGHLSHEGSEALGKKMGFYNLITGKMSY